jgi:cytochrome c556
MRIAFFVTIACVALAGCGGPETSQANNSQSNISNESRADENAAASNLQLRLALGDAKNIMHVRHEGMELIGKTGKAMNRELTTSSPNLAVVHAGAARIASLSMQASAWFPEGTGPEVGKTGAKPEIWLPQNKADFAGKLHDFQVAAAALNAAAAGNDLPLIKARFDQAEHACKACHDKYRMDMHH